MSPLPSNDCLECRVANELYVQFRQKRSGVKFRRLPSPITELAPLLELSTYLEKAQRFDYQPFCPACQTALLEQLNVRSALQ